MIAQVKYEPLIAAIFYTDTKYFDISVQDFHPQVVKKGV